MLRSDALTRFLDPLGGAFGCGHGQRKQPLARLALHPGDRLLHLGCGTGSVPIVAQRRRSARQAAAVDADAKTLAGARSKAVSAGV